MLSDKALTTLTQVKSFLSIALSDTSNDSVLCMLINAASDEVHRYIDRDIVYGTKIQRHSGDDLHNVIYLDAKPIEEVIKIEKLAFNSFDGSIDYLNQLDNTPKDNNVGRLRLRDYLWYEVKTTTGNLNNDTRGPIDSYKIEYKAGYKLPGDPERNLPYDIEMVVIDLVTSKFSTMSIKSGMQGLKELKQGDVTYKFDKDSSMRYEQLDRLKKYKRTILRI